MASGIQATDHGKRSRQLNFEKAMSDFKNMFPSIDVDVIEMVLRANNGLVDATVDQLLTMQGDESNNSFLDPDLNVRLPGYNDSGSSSNEPPPAYTPRVEDDPNFVYDLAFLAPRATENFATPSQDTQVNKYKPNDWNPPLLGNLPQDFLRISLNDRTSQSLRNGPSESPGNDRQTSMASTEIIRTPLSRPDEKYSVDRRSDINGLYGVIPDNSESETKSKSVEHKSKSKRFGQMSRKFKRKKTKGTKNNYKPISFANLVDDDSSDENAQR